MSKIVTSATVFQDAVGMRISMTYSEVNDDTGTIISDNNRLNRLVTDSDAKANGNAVLAYAQEFVDALED